MITVGFSTRKINSKFVDHIKNTIGIKNVEIIPIENDGVYSLTQAYNMILDQASNNIVVLCHDDIEIETKSWGHKLRQLFNENSEYGIIGLAGSKYLPESGRWWDVPQSMYGIVNHKHEGKKWESKYSKDLKNNIEDTIIVDGLFIALDKTKIKSNFDENVKGFHFYDLNFCLDNFIKKVGIGVTTKIRVTHLSIGQTNEEWEVNRTLFIDKFKDHLPINISNTEDVSTFIMVHDQEIILEYEKNKKYKNITNLKYVFLGSKNIEKIESLDNVIVARNLNHNLEEFPNINAFTGWYALWKNNLIRTKYVNLFEYDTIIDDKLFVVLSKLMGDGFDMLGYIPVSCSNYHFIDNPEWTEQIFKSIAKNYKIDLRNQIKNMMTQTPNMVWSSTSNTTFRTSVLNDYMNWFLPILTDILQTKTAGHAHERSTTFFSYMTNKKFLITNNLIKHFQLDSHKTQGHPVNFENSFEKLKFNTL
jgi:hypothetical protein